jgi:hypothetical protein
MDKIDWLQSFIVAGIESKLCDVSYPFTFGIFKVNSTSIINPFDDIYLQERIIHVAKEGQLDIAKWLYTLLKGDGYITRQKMFTHVVMKL